jgi:hypothetical protein
MWRKLSKCYCNDLWVGMEIKHIDGRKGKIISINYPSECFIVKWDNSEMTHQVEVSDYDFGYSVKGDD